MWGIFYSTIVHTHPKYELQESIIGTNPGLGFRPMPPESNVESTLIWFEENNEKNTEYWVDEIRNFLTGFAENRTKDGKPVNKHGIDCTKNNRVEPEEHCKVDLSKFGDCTEAKGFGFERGKPCIFLKLNKIYNWEPEYYTDVNDLPEKMPQSLKDHIKVNGKKYDMKVVWVSCEGENPADVDNLGQNISFKSLSGEQGFLGKYFPFKSTEGYLQPLVAVQFENVKSESQRSFCTGNVNSFSLFSPFRKRFDEHRVQGLGQEHFPRSR
jgi:sodium/potassium-transporting ATPase subunit beta